MPVGDQTANSGDIVEIDGSGSADKDGQLTVTNNLGASDTDTVVVKVLPAGMASILDDFNVDSRAEYTVVDTWTQEGEGQFSYDFAGRRLRLLMEDNIGLEFGCQLPASEQGVF